MDTLLQGLSFVSPTAGNQKGTVIKVGKYILPQVPGEYLPPSIERCSGHSISIAADRLSTTSLPWDA